MAVIVTGPKAAPRVLERLIVELSDPEVPAARQPYHAATGLAREEGSAELLGLLAGVESYAQRSLAQLLDRPAPSDHRLCAGGLAVGSDIDPARIGNPHIRAHASEGRLFRRVIETALRDRRLPCTVFVERNLPGITAGVLGHGDRALKQVLTELGRSVEGSWRRDDKMAALAAWLALAAHDASPALR